jgi:ligand-binding SRPBCC domain-containing protein
MAEIIIETRIGAPIERCFDLARSIELHLACSADTGEKAVAGVCTGLIQLNQTVTWRARHIWWQELTSEITKYDRPKSFQDTMVKGYFKHFCHDHEFIECQGFTLMIDKIAFASPFGIIGKAIDFLVLDRYLTEYIQRKNAHLKMVAENEKLAQPYLQPGTNGD